MVWSHLANKHEELKAANTLFLVSHINMRLRTCGTMLTWLHFLAAVDFLKVQYE